MIPYGHQQISDADVAAVVDVLRSEFLTQGPAVPRFEMAVAAYAGARYGVAACNGTAALHLACAALGLGPGDRLWTSAITFAASANCGRYCGADVQFVDIDPDDYNLSVPALREKLVAAKRTGTLPTIVVSVHLAGQPPAQEAVWQLSREFGFKVIEDASHAVGATRHSEPVGSCRWSHITTFSFHPVKLITTGEGGMAMTNDDVLAERMRLLRSHGITRDPALMTTGAHGPAQYEQIELGWNYRLTDLQAALGASQLSRLEDFVARRNALARRYHRELDGLSLQLPAVHAGNRSAYHLYVVRLPKGSRSNQDVIQALRDLGVGATLHYPAVHLHPYYRRLGFAPGDYPEAERYAQDALTLPLHAGLSHDEQDRVVHAMATVLAH